MPFMYVELNSQQHRWLYNIIIIKCIVLGCTTLGNVKNKVNTILRRCPFPWFLSFCVATKTWQWRSMTETALISLWDVDTAKDKLLGKQMIPLTRKRGYKHLYIIVVNKLVLSFGYIMRMVTWKKTVQWKVNFIGMS